MATKQLEVTDEETIAVRDALAEEMLDHAKAIKRDLNEHLNDGSSVGLADARDSLRLLNRLADVMEKLDAPGWKTSLGPYSQPGNPVEEASE